MVSQNLFNEYDIRGHPTNIEMCIFLVMILWHTLHISKYVCYIYSCKIVGHPTHIKINIHSLDIMRRRAYESS